MNTYAIEQGYESWDYFISDQPIYKREEHYFIIMDLVQDELKKNISKEEIVIEFINEFGDSEEIYVVSVNSILNTENL
jgi:methionyl-tRNA synthetase